MESLTSLNAPLHGSGKLLDERKNKIGFIWKKNIYQEVTGKARLNKTS